MSRIVAIVGRPNVGKSALFNRLAGRKISIVHDQPGVTRDRLAAECRLTEEPFTIIDTGGIGSAVDASFTEQVRTEADIAINSADVIVFVVDAQSGLTPVDEELAKTLRRTRKPLLLLVNKVDHVRHDGLQDDFARLGFEHVLPFSAEHARGVADLLEWIGRELPPPQEEDAVAPPAPIEIALVGRPNVGKSSLTNAILGDERSIVSAISGTTRDAVDIPYERRGQPYILIDTAGIRPRGRHDSSVEVFSVMRSERSIRRADLCILVLDVTAGVTAQDKKIAGLIQQSHKPCVIVANKSDLIDKETLEENIEALRAELFFLDYAPLILLSAQTKQHLSRLFRAVDRVVTGARTHLSTGPLNRLLKVTMERHPPPARGGRRLKVLYGTHADPGTKKAINPPQFVLFVNDDALMVPTYQKYLDAQIRTLAPFEGLPLLFEMRGRPRRKK